MIYDTTMPTMTDTLFVQELDGRTFASLEDAMDWPYDVAHQADGPVWSNYGGWVN